MSEPITFTDKAGRVITLRELDPGDMLDLLEAAGPASTNDGFMRYAMVVGSLASIDGVPVPSARTKDALRGAAKKLGNDGFTRAAEALFGSVAQAQVDPDAAKN